MIIKTINCNIEFELPKLYHDKWFLYWSYCWDKKSMEKISVICDCSNVTILNWLREFDIKVRKNDYKYKNKSYRDKWFLFFSYIVDKKSSVEISKICNCSYQIIIVWLRRFDIPIRDISEAGKIAMNRPETIRRNSEGQKRRYSDPNERKKISDRNKILMNKPGWKEQHSKFMKKKWDDLEFRKKHRKSMELVWDNLEVREKLRQARLKQIFPKKDTKIEVKLQNFLKELNIEFKTHKVIKIEHYYQCDIYISSLNLVIEADGNYWHNYPYGNPKDHIRTYEMEEKGYNILRLWEMDINKLTLEQFKNKIDVFT